MSVGVVFVFRVVFLLDLSEVVAGVRSSEVIFDALMAFYFGSGGDGAWIGGEGSVGLRSRGRVTLLLMMFDT